MGEVYQNFIYWVFQGAIATDRLPQRKRDFPDPAKPALQPLDAAAAGIKLRWGVEKDAPHPSVYIAFPTVIRGHFWSA
ncbi:hypothetical protein J0895_24295 [Phormidium pseudopriestleyi FRX01]|uniref:Uncharacterized protein n=1 Tax=Phormidium pseudopriestleyi FRX01 TaxID=1759528 RepID=A0ABS3FYD2_9CYAN|nr:hypothetical protein [Phormidium pseudopriestleyi]MBO0352145.1 hypothetical protein [Phormidium pseudopriestleyi FRX01]